MPEAKVMIPKPGLLVRDPATMQPLSPEGAAKPVNSYWRRRLRDGDVRLAEQHSAPSARKKGED